MYLLSSVTTSQFIICLKIIAKYSAIIEPVTNILQGIDCDVLYANEHIKKLIKHITNDRFKSDDIFLSLMDDVNKYLIELGIELQTPRMASKQTPSSDPVYYYRKSVFIPYLDSLIISLNDRFAEDFTVVVGLILAPPSRRTSGWFRE